MRIFFVTNNYTPYSGGVVQSINAAVKALQEEGNEVFIVTLSFLEDHSDDPKHIIRLYSSLRFKYKNNHMAFAWRATHQIEKLIKNYKPDIIHLHHPFFLGASALTIAKKYGIPTVFTHHTLYEEYVHYIPGPLCILKPIIRYIVKQFCDQVDTIIVPSGSVKKYLLSQKVATPIAKIVSPIRDCFIYSSQEIKERKEESLFRLLLVTRFTPEKNIPFVFEVIKKLPEHFILTLVGYGVDYKRMQELAYNRLNLSPERVQFVYKPNEATLLSLYRGADLFLFPSQTDTQGLVLAESMSQSVPVVALDGPGQRDIIINNENGFIINNAQEAANIINKIAEDNILLARLKKGALTISQRYHSSSIVKELQELYLSLL